MVMLISWWLEVLKHALCHFQWRAFASKKIVGCRRYYITVPLGLGQPAQQAFLCGLGAKNEERESKTVRQMAQVKELGGCFGFRFISPAVKTENTVPRSFFARKPNGNACYAGQDWADVNGPNGLCDCFVDGFFYPVFFSPSVGTLRNYNGDGNGNVKKAIGVSNEQNNNSARASRFFVHYKTLRTLRSDNGDVHKNVAEKQTSYPFNIFRNYSKGLSYLKEENFGWS